MKIALATQHARQFIKIQCVRAALSGLAIVAVGAAVPQAPAFAQTFPISSVEIDGNQRIEDATILSYLRLERGQAASAAQLNDAIQRLQRSGLFETVDVVPVGNRLVVTVKEYPTINRVNIEGNKRLKDADLIPLLQSKSRRVYSPSTAEADAALLAEGYNQAGRIAATVTPRIIPRSNNRVDLVFEISEGDVVEVERISFIGNRAYSDRRLRRVVDSKQAGLLRSIIQSDTFVSDRIAFDRQLLRDFYLSRGYVDFQVLSSTPELTRERDGYFVSFKVREGQQFKVGQVTTYSDLPEIDIDEYQNVARLKAGEVYSPAKIENTITRMERLALQKGLNFIRVEPRITRNDADITLDVEFAIIRGPRVFVERIDIEGNATTLDRVVRRQFKTVEGDPFNPREIRDAAERIRALGYFSTADVNTRQGSGPEQVVVDVDVEETTTGSLGFGVSYGADAGASFSVTFQERNFLGRGQTLAFSFDTGSDNQNTSINFIEPAFLGRDLALGLNLYYRTTDNQYAAYDTQNVGFEPSIEFPVSENGRLRLNYRISKDAVKNVDPTTSVIIQRDESSAFTSALGYLYSYDTRRTGLNPNGGVLLRFGQQIAGVGGGLRFLQTTGLIAAETKIAREEVTLRAQLEFGANTRLTGNSRITERFFLNSSKMRGFDGAGVGPRDLASTNQDALGGNYYAVARLEADFPLGLPEEYGIRGGVFFDVGSLWGLDDTNNGTAAGVDDSFKLRSVIGVSVLWDTQIGPLRFNFSKALVKETYDRERSFDLTVSTQF
ncbi:outer membrane protein assembly factor BamA [Litoreibacter janthinus]|uniref:Outer membrane protein assembly factor BamA n=1 Tax=Litoreibacter janthinus TaxID=670154 RepID=A0A1I6H3D7_9RHOB|nr:outer membrane protein assembly factor BamA [Litoreibacter janthinus]SFR48909.1 Beta-barrel assembly machine subunit BamA [Litoreibacter janthinus]